MSFGEGSGVSRATRALVHLDYLRENIALLRQKTGKKICLPIKAGAYGHGALPIAKTALAAGVDYLAIATVEEARELREGGIASPIMIFSLCLPEEMDALVALDLEPMVCDLDYIESLEKAVLRARGGAGKKLGVHLKIDTGMGRIGCDPADAAALAARITGSKHLALAGTATHFAASDSLAPDDIAYTHKQTEVFAAALERIKKAGIDPGIIHAANSGAVTFHNGSWFEMVRPGILLYGYAPLNSTGLPALAVKPLMELRSALTFIKHIKKGESISYGRTWTAAEDTFIGTLPLGYADGLSRKLSNNWNVAVLSGSAENQSGGTRRPLAGRICMDQCMVDLGKDNNARRWDPVAVFGGFAPDAGIMAASLGTIPYEITCNIDKRVPRVYI
jgi:alanine racemase